MKKILFLTSHLHAGGAERTIAYLSGYFTKSFDVSILSFERDVVYTLNPRVNFLCLDIKPDSSNIKRLFNIIKRYWGVWKIVHREKPDVVFCMLPPMLKYLTPLELVQKFKIVSSERNNPFYDNEISLEAKHKLFEKCDGVIFQTRQVCNLFPEIKQKCFIHNAVGNPQIMDAANIREKSNIANKIVSVGRLSYQKNWAFLIDVFSVIHKDYPEMIYEIYGDGPDKKKIVEKIKLLNQQNNIVLKGVCTDLALQIANARVFMMASRYEGMPNALMEALAIGIPCVSTDCDYGPAELIENEQNGLLVSKNASVNEFADSVKKFLRDDSFAASCGRNGRKISQTHSVDVLGQRYLDFVHSLLEQKK